MRKRTVVLFAVSLVAGLLKTPKKKKDQLNGETDPRFFVGSWNYSDQEQHSHLLSITPDLHLTLDQRPIRANVEAMTAYQLTFLDALGYHLIVKANENGPVAFYDEADNVTYPLKKN